MLFRSDERIGAQCGEWKRGEEIDENRREEIKEKRERRYKMRLQAEAEKKRKKEKKKKRRMKERWRGEVI